MTFNKSKVYTALNEDELKAGYKVYVSDNMYYLRECVEEGLEPCILTRVLSEKEPKRFCIDDKSNEKWQLAYLIEPPAGSKYKPFESVDKAMEAILKHGGWIKSKDGNKSFFLSPVLTRRKMFFALCLNIGIRLIFFLQNSYGPMMTVLVGNWWSRNDLSKLKEL